MYRKSTKLEIGAGEFSKLIGETILLNIPIIYLEGFSYLRSSIKSDLLSVPDVVFSAVGLSGHNPIMSFFTAEMYKRIKVVIFQHGGNYGLDCVHAHEDLERSLSDYYITWGWEDSSDRLIPLPSPILDKYRVKSCSKISRHGISLIMTSVPRYTYRIQQHISSSNMLDLYLSDTCEFISALDTMRAQLLVRKSQRDYGWLIEDRLKTQFRSLKFDNHENKFIHTITNSRICVFNSLGTTYIQSMVANRPTVIFITPSIYCHRKEAKFYYDGLKSAGIMYYSPTAAAVHIENVYDDVEEWWYSAKVQKARKAFINRYGLSSDDWVEQWINMVDSTV